MASKPTGRPRGRPTRCTPHIIEITEEAAQRGATWKEISGATGIHKATLTEWVRRGEGTDDREPRPEYVEFATRYKAARSTFEAGRRTIIRTAATPHDEKQTVVEELTEPVRRRDGTIVLTPDGEVLHSVRRSERTTINHDRFQWQAAAWELERVMPDEYGRVSRQQLEVSGPQGQPLTVQLPEDQLIAEADKRLDELATRRRRKASSNGHAL